MEAMDTEIVALNMDHLEEDSLSDESSSKEGTKSASSSPGEIPYRMKHSIFRVPAYIRYRNPTAYTPNVVSIGPYHHGQPHLANMEVHKQRALQQLLRRSNKSYKVYLDELRKLLPELRESYQQLDKWWDNDDNFLGLMTRDGAFLYEYMRYFANELASEYECDDPVFSLYGKISLYPSITRDIVMIENQLPLQILERLIAVETGRIEEMHGQVVNGLVFNLLHRFEVYFPVMETRLHVLDIARKSITRDIRSIRHEERNRETQVRSASDLADAGLVFRHIPARGSNGILCWKNRILYLPQLRFDTITEPLFLNSIAFERLRPTAGHRVSSYIAFMSGLIRSAEDVRLLRFHNLIDSKIGGDDVVAKLMNTVSQDVLFDPYSDLCKVRDFLNDYYAKSVWRLFFRGLRRYVHNAWTMLKQIYFSNPWKIFSVLAAAYLLVLTTLQTYYTVLGYYKDKKG